MSPNGRAIAESKTNQRIAGLKAFELAYKPTKIDYSALFGEEAWKKHMGNLSTILQYLEAAEKHAFVLRDKAAKHAIRTLSSAKKAAAQAEDVESASLMAAASGKLCLPELKPTL